ncbi:MAG: carboxypeptidase-like regulatory domain-containing protein [Acidobacteriota bacterium]
MIRSRESAKSPRLLAVICVLIGIWTPSLEASSLGRLKGLIQNESGEPLADVLVTLLEKSSRKVLPILTRTDEAGQILFKDIEAGYYEILVKSADYRNPAEVIRIMPGETALVRLVLQQLFHIEGAGEQNLGVKTLLRSQTDPRLIFRGMPGSLEESLKSQAPLRREAVFEVYSNSGFGNDYFTFPGDSAGGTTTNFAVTQSFGGASDYVFAGQLNSGEDSLWRFKNFITLDLAENHSVNVIVGYGRMSFDQPSLSLMQNPISIGNDQEYTRASGTAKMMNFGFEDTFRLGDLITAIWGLELHQVRTDQNYSFVSPSAQVVFHPSESTDVRILMASKRPTQGNTIVLPETGEAINLSDSVYLSRIGSEISLGSSRFYRASVSQKLDSNTAVELAAYQSRLFRGAVPFLAVFEYQPETEVFRLDDPQADDRGYRVSLRREFTENLKAQFSYLQGNAVGVNNERLTLVFDSEAMHSLLKRQNYHCVSAQIEGHIPTSRTKVTALVKMVPSGKPLMPMDVYSDVYETSNQGLSLFVRQIVPMPNSFLGFFGLDFLSTYQFEVLMDVRNLTNENLGEVETLQGDVVLLRNPRTIRGGISLRF